MKKTKKLKKPCACCVQLDAQLLLMKEKMRPYLEKRRAEFAKNHPN